VLLHYLVKRLSGTSLSHSGQRSRFFSYRVAASIAANNTLMVQAPRRRIWTEKYDFITSNRQTYELILSAMTLWVG